jgi:hypothetical protein
MGNLPTRNVDPCTPQGGVNKELWHRLHQFGVLGDRLVDLVWTDVPHQKTALLALMQKFDLIAERLPAKNVVSYFLAVECFRCNCSS